MMMALIQFEIRSILRNGYGWGGSLGFMALSSIFFMMSAPLTGPDFSDLSLSLFWTLLCLSLFLQVGSFFDDEIPWGGIDLLTQTPGAFGFWVFIRMMVLSGWNMGILGASVPICFLFLGIDVAHIPQTLMGMVFLLPIIIGLMALVGGLCLSCKLPVFMRPLLVGPLMVPFLLFVQGDSDPFARALLMGSALAIPPLCTALIDVIHKKVGF